jgi:hypothetical protein
LADFAQASIFLLNLMLKNQSEACIRRAKRMRKPSWIFHTN